MLLIFTDTMPVIYKMLEWVENGIKYRSLLDNINDYMMVNDADLFNELISNNDEDFTKNQFMQKHITNILNTNASISSDCFEYLSCNPNAIQLLEANQDKIYWTSLSCNPNAIHLLEANEDRVDWDLLSTNPNAIHLLEANPGRINFYYLSRNSNAMNLIKNQLEINNRADYDFTFNFGLNISWSNLSSNPNAIELLESNFTRICWETLSLNPAAIHLLEANPDKIDWRMLSYNPNAIHLLEANLSKINWNKLSGNLNAIHLLEANQDKIDWCLLSNNSNAIHLLEANKKKIDWHELLKNPSIFELDYASMKESTTYLHEELMAYIYHPSRVTKWLDKYGYEREYLE